MAFYGRLDGSQGLSERAREMSPQPQFDPRRVQEVATRYNESQPYTVSLQMNGAVSKVNKTFISHLTRAKRTPLAAAGNKPPSTFHRLIL